MMLVGKTGMSAPFSRLSAMVNARAPRCRRGRWRRRSRRRETGLHDSVRVQVARERGRHRPAKVLKIASWLLQGMAASGGPDSRPKISEPSVRMATVLRDR